MFIWLIFILKLFGTSDATDRISISLYGIQVPNIQIRFCLTKFLKFWYIYLFSQIFGQFILTCSGSDVVHVADIVHSFSSQDLEIVFATKWIQPIILRWHQNQTFSIFFFVLKVILNMSCSNGCFYLCNKKLNQITVNLLRSNLIYQRIVFW